MATFFISEDIHFQFDQLEVDIQIELLCIFEGNAEMSQVEDDVRGGAEPWLILWTVGMGGCHPS